MQPFPAMRNADDAVHAGRPFALTGRIELREILGRRARDERELMEEIEQAPAESIYHHTTRQLREYFSIMVHLTA